MQPINLLPDIKTRRRERLQLSLPRIVANAAIVWLLLLAGVYGWFYWQQRTLSDELQLMQAEIEALEPVAQRVAALQERTTLVRGLQQLLATNTQGRVVPMVDLVASLMPVEVRADQIAIDQGRISLSCYSSALAPIGQFYSNLQQTQQFQTIQVSAITSVEQSQLVSGGYVFTLTLELQGAESNE